MRKSWRGFTLIELLVVVAIVALLIALLLPTLAAARAQAKGLKCAANMRSMALGVLMFSSEHSERGPGGAYAAAPVSKYLGWDAVLNVEHFNIPTFWPSANQRFLYIQAGGDVPKSWALNCPAAMDREPVFQYVAAFGYNADAAGGLSWAVPGTGEWGPYGMPRDPDTVSVQYKQAGVTLTPNPKTTPQTLTTGYWWGARISRFNPDQILLREVANANGYFSNKSPGASYVDANGYSYNNGAIAFRHPFGQKANFAFFDMHVESMGVRDSWNKDARFLMP